MRKLSLTKSEFDAEGVRLDTAFQQGFALDMVRSGKIGGKKKYFKDEDGKLKSRKRGIWARVTRIYQYKKRPIMPALPQYADPEDTGRSPADMTLQVEHLQYRYHKCRDIQTGEPLKGEARKEWEKTREARQDWLPEKNRKRGGHIKTDTIGTLTEIFQFVSKLDDEGVKRYQELVPQYQDGDEAHYA